MLKLGKHGNPLNYTKSNEKNNKQEKIKIKKRQAGGFNLNLVTAFKKGSHNMVLLNDATVGQLGKNVKINFSKDREIRKQIHQIVKALRVKFPGKEIARALHPIP